MSGNHTKGLSLRFNVVDYMAHHEEAVVFKIDNVDGGFLEFILDMKGFGSRWRSWSSGCLSSTKL